MQIPIVPPTALKGSESTPSRQQALDNQHGTPGGTSNATLQESVKAVKAVGLTQASQQNKAWDNQQFSMSEQLKTSLEQLNSVAALYNSQLEFSVDDETNLRIVKIVDKESQKVIRQIPSEEAIRIAKAIGEFKGMLLQEVA